MVKLKETNLDGVKAMARTLVFTDIHNVCVSCGEFFVKHFVAGVIALFLVVTVISPM